jgi:5'-3' exonuclease
METTVVIDGDTILYGAFKYRDWGPASDPTKFTEEQDSEYLLKGLAQYKGIISSIEDATYADKVLVAVKGEGNFRSDIFPDYKLYRKSSYRPVNGFVEALRRYAIDCLGAIPAHGMEADDLLRIWHNEELAKGNECIIAHIDKDLMAIPGKHYRFVKIRKDNVGRRPSFITVYHGDNVNITNVTEEEAARSYYTQLLTGDSTDNIPGLPQIGPERANAILEECNTEAEMRKMVCYAYQTLIGDNWEEALILTGRLITMLPHRDYIFNINGWI